MKKTIGGDRLGSGKKMQVDLRNFERSTHDKGYLWRSTMSAGTLVPFLVEIALPGDTWDIDLNCIMKTHPTVGPLFGSYKVQLDVFQAPIRLYNSLLHNNALGIGLDMSVVHFPEITLTSRGIDHTKVQDLDNCQINPSCLLSYLGIRGIGNSSGVTPRNFNALPILIYWDIYKNYYANKSEEIGAVIHTPSAALINTVTGIDLETPPDPPQNIPSIGTNTAADTFANTTLTLNYAGTTPDPSQVLIDTYPHGYIPLSELVTAGFTNPVAGVLIGNFDYPRWGQITLKHWKYKDATDLSNGKPAVATFTLDNIDSMREDILKAYSKTTPFNINTNVIYPYQWLIEAPNGIPNILSSQEGLALKTYQSDLFNNWMPTEWIDGSNGINAVTAIDTTAGSFTIDTLNLSRKVYDMLNRIAISGGTYDDWLDAVYTEERYKRCETPMYMGGLSKELVFQEVVSNATADNSTQGEQPLGSLAGKGIMSDKHKGGHVVIKVDEPSYIMGIISLTPRIDYSQGNKWHVNLKTMNDLHKPDLDQIGFQELITEQMAWWSTEYDGTDWLQKSAGKQPAWLNYMTNVNEVRGNFAISKGAGAEMFMTLNRRYELNSSTGDIKDLTTYIDPSKFNNIFAQTALDAQNFWAQIAVDITYRGKISAKIMPNL